MEVERGPHDRPTGTSLGAASLFLAVAAAGMYTLSLLLISFIILFPQLIPDDAPGIAAPALVWPPASFALGVLASLLGLSCILLGRRGRSCATAALLIGVLLVALTAVFTFRPWEVLEPLLRG